MIQETPITVRAVRKRTAPVRVILDIVRDGETHTFLINETTYLSFGEPRSGDALDEAAFEEIRFADERGRAVRCAVTILSYADNSKELLRKKLFHRGFSPEATEDAVREVVRLGYLSEQKQISSLVEGLCNVKLLGVRRMTGYLMSRGYARENIEEVYREFVEDGTIDPEENFRKLLSRHHVSPDDKAKIRYMRYQYGY